MANAGSSSSMDYNNPLNESWTTAGAPATTHSGSLFPERITRWEAEWMVNRMDKIFVKSSNKSTKRKLIKSDWERFARVARSRYDWTTCRDIYAILRRNALRSMTLAAEFRLVTEFLKESADPLVIDSEKTVIPTASQLFAKSYLKKVKKKNPGMSGQDALAELVNGGKKFAQMTPDQQSVWHDKISSLRQKETERHSEMLNSCQFLDFLDDFGHEDLVKFANDHSIQMDDPLPVGFDRYLAFKRPNFERKYPGNEDLIISKCRKKYDKMSDEIRTQWETPAEDDVEELRNKIRSVLKTRIVEPLKNKKPAFAKVPKVDQKSPMKRGTKVKEVDPNSLEGRLAQLDLAMPPKPPLTTYSMFQHDFSTSSYCKLPSTATPKELISEMSSSWRHLTKQESLELSRQWAERVEDYNRKIEHLLDQVADPILKADIKLGCRMVPSTTTAQKRTAAVLASWNRAAKRQKLDGLADDAGASQSAAPGSPSLVSQNRKITDFLVGINSPAGAANGIDDGDDDGDETD